MFVLLFKLYVIQKNFLIDGEKMQYQLVAYGFEKQLFKHFQIVNLREQKWSFLHCFPYRSSSHSDGNSCHSFSVLVAIAISLSLLFTRYRL